MSFPHPTPSSSAAFTSTLLFAKTRKGLFVTNFVFGTRSSGVGSCFFRPASMRSMARPCMWPTIRSSST
jgi:hypothetical protein